MTEDKKTMAPMQLNRKIKPEYAKIHDWEFYTSSLAIEYQQSIEEGLDIEAYKDVFDAVAKLPKDEVRNALGDVLFEIVCNAKQREGYLYTEPSDLEGIKALRKPYEYEKRAGESLENKIAGAWLGRVSGCLLGKPVEGYRTNKLVPFLKASGNYPIHRYIVRSDINEEVLNMFPGFQCNCYTDDFDGMPADDDTNYTVLYQKIIEEYGKDFTPEDVAQAWVRSQQMGAYCTAERVAFRNFVFGFLPPESAMYKNPYREWIGAQIRADYFGYINPGDPQMAAEMAWRDASISHIKNGIYGEMFVAAMLAVAAETNVIEDIIRGGLAQIPHTSRLYEQACAIIDQFNSGVSEEDCFKYIHSTYDEHTGHGWCHTIPNAMIVVASLLYGKGDFGRSIGMSVENGFDTDCNGATVGSILGMANGSGSIPESWAKPVNDTLYTSIFGLSKVKVSDRVALTLKHINQ